MVVSVPVVIVAFIYANRIARTLEVMVVPEKQELMHHTPSLFKSLLLIGMPVLLIATASIIDLFYDVSNTFTAVIGFTV
ncbi:MAG: hypothetical protein KatS3mg032_0754 [Cyclobacteriaceae bacterium]|nr:MAG: hypothetical protein KatS3mg032_0754 [Cyclobacteriaceae bacterium]